MRNLNYNLINKYCFVVLKPDVFLRDILKSVLEWFYSLSFSVIEYRCAYLNSKIFFNMYYNRFCWKHDSWKHNSKAFEFSPALGIVLHNEKLNSNLLKYLNELKGNPLPYLRDSNSIRFKFQSRSRIFNIIHVPDDFLSMQNEMCTWFNKESVSNLKNKNILKTHYSINDILEDIINQDYKSQNFVDPEYTFIKIKIRLIHAIEKSIVFFDTKYFNNHLFKNLKNHYNNWCLLLQSMTKTNNIEGSLILECQKKELFLIENIVNYINEIYHQGFCKLKKTVIYLRDFLLNENKINQNNDYSESFFILLKINNVYYSKLEHYLIKSRLKYAKYNK